MWSCKRGSDTDSILFFEDGKKSIYIDGRDCLVHSFVVYDCRIGCAGLNGYFDHKISMLRVPPTFGHIWGARIKWSTMSERPWTPRPLMGSRPDGCQSDKELEKEQLQGWEQCVMLALTWGWLDRCNSTRVPVTSLAHCPLIGPLDDSTLANGKINGISWGLMGLSCKTMEFNRFNGISWDVSAEISRKMVGM